MTKSSKDGKRYHFLFRRQTPKLGDSKMKKLEDMTPAEVDAELRLRVAQLQRTGFLPTVNSLPQTVGEQHKLSLASTTGVSHHAAANKPPTRPASKLRLKTG